MKPETQECIERFLTEHFEALEQTMDAHRKEFSRLDEDTLDFGRPLTDDVLEALIEPVTRTTRNFLRIEDVPGTVFKRWKACTEARNEFADAMAKGGWLVWRFVRGLAHGLDTLLGVRPHSYYTAYRGVVIGSKRSIPAVSALIHEYTHHIQYHIAGVSPLSDRWFMEGHARGVQRCLCRKYAEKNDNPAYMYTSLRSTAWNLTYGYQLVCRRAGREPRKELLYRPLKDAGKMDAEDKHYGLGVAEFCVHELMYGEEMYAEDLKAAKDKTPADPGSSAAPRRDPR